MKDMSIEEKMAFRLKEKLEDGKTKSEKLEKIEDKNEELSMLAPEKCGDLPCDDTCNKKVEAVEELKKDIMEEKEVIEEIIKEEKKEYKILGIMFETTRKRYYFEVVDNVEYSVGDRAIVDTARGKEIGLVYMAPKIMSEDKLVLPLKSVIRKAIKEDNEKYELLKSEAAKATGIGKEKVKKHALPMKLIATEFTFDKSKLIFYFTAEGRIDFRDLVKELATIFKLRIELRQIGVRDEARILGSVGICGKELCCRLYIDKFDSVLIKMARDQGLVINPAKISGSCGRLLCCIKYEYQQYAEALLKCPNIGQTIMFGELRGRVVGVNPLNEYIYADVEGKGRIRLDIEEVTFDKKEGRKEPKKNYKGKKKNSEEQVEKKLEAK